MIFKARLSSEELLEWIRVAEILFLYEESVAEIFFLHKHSIQYDAFYLRFYAVSLNCVENDNEAGRYCVCVCVIMETGER